MKILVATDFSKPADVALRYAARLSKHLKAEIVLLHAIYLNAPPRAQGMLHTVTIEKAMEDTAKQDCTEAILKIKKEIRGLKITPAVVKGFPINDVIENYGRHHGVDLIVMGTKGASGLKKVFIGSNATAVINHSSIPVITVPELARFHTLKNILYATDMSHMHDEVKAVAPLAKIFNARLNVAHVMAVNSRRYIDIERTTAALIKTGKYSEISFCVVLNSSITDGIAEAVADTNAEMLVLFSRRHGYIQKLTGQSVTHRMAFHLWIPMLTLRK